MKAYMLMTGSGALMILSSHTSIEDAVLLEKLAAKGIEKFLSYEVPIELAQARYGGHFSVVANDLRETDDLLELSRQRGNPLASRLRIGVIPTISPSRSCQRMRRDRYMRPPHSA